MPRNIRFRFHRFLLCCGIVMARRFSSTRCLISMITVLLPGKIIFAAETNTLTFGFDDYLLAPLRIHLLTSTEAPDIATTLKASDIRRILGKINTVWSQAGIHFYLESLVKEAPKNGEHFSHPEMEPGLSWLLQLRPGASVSSNAFHLYYVKQMRGNGVYLPEGIFVKDTASLREVPGGID